MAMGPSMRAPRPPSSAVGAASSLWRQTQDEAEAHGKEDGSSSPSGAIGAANKSWRRTIAQAEACGVAAERIAELHATLEGGEGGALVLHPAFLRCCLRARRYDVPRAKSLALNYVAFRKQSRWHAEGGSPRRSLTVCASALERELRSGFNLLLPGTDAYGHAVITQRMSLLAAALSPRNSPRGKGKGKGRKGGGSGGSGDEGSGGDESSGSSEEGYGGVDGAPNVESLQRAGYYLVHRTLQLEAAQTRGVALLLDFGQIRWSTFRRIGYADVRRGVRMLQDCFPLRLAVIYVLHPPSWISAVLSLLAPFLKRDSFQQKLFLLSSVAGDEPTSLHAHIPPTALPAGVADWEGSLPLDWDATVDAWMAEEAARERGETSSEGMAPAAASFDPADLLTMGEEHGEGGSSAGAGESEGDGQVDMRVVEVIEDFY